MAVQSSLQSMLSTYPQASQDFSQSVVSQPSYPDQFDIMVTVGCNAKCAFCVQEATYKPDGDSDRQFFQALNIRFQQFYQQGGRKVIITGGEPLLALPRVLGVLQILSQFSDLKVKALYTNGSRLLQPWSQTSSMTVAQVLQLAGLGCVNLSVHHDCDRINREIFGLPHQPPTPAITEHLNLCRLPFRLNLTLQQGGIATAEAVKRYIEWGLQLGAQDIYIRGLFQFSFDQAISKSDRDAISYCRSHAVTVCEILARLTQDPDFHLEACHKNPHLSQREYRLIHNPTHKQIYFSSLTIGQEDRSELPYLVLMPNSSLYKGWLGEADQLD